MAFTAKKLLLIFDLPGVLFYLNNPRLPHDPHLSRIKVNYQETHGQLQMSVRQGKPELLNYLFMNLKQDVDVAVWSSLSHESTGEITHKYFTRYFRDLLFVMATNRKLYGEQPEHLPLRIRRDLSSVYSRFTGYNECNTMVVTAHENLLESHIRNDLKVPEYSPSNPDFPTDPGLIPLAKYIQGLVMVKNESGINDIRRFISAKEASNIFKRTIHNNTTDRIYI